MRKVFFAGPLPPPVHGFAVINGHMLAGLQQSNAQVEVFDLAPRSLFAPLLKWCAFLRSVLKPSNSQGNSLYLPISGGIRQLVDLMFVIPAKWLGFSIFVHHHSFAYLNAQPWFSRLAFLVLKEATHIVLCPSMGLKLCDQYGITSGQIRVLSNAAFLDIGIGAANKVAASSSCLTLGFLSNITAEKGIFSFFDALDALSTRRIPFQALIAGPVSPEIKAQFDERLAATAGVQHVGAVYGDAKHEFFGQLDLLLFPTLYANEAEPVTLWESMAYGVPVIALQRGCIQGMLASAGGIEVSEPSLFALAVVEAVEEMLAEPALLRQRRVRAKDAFVQAQRSSRLTLASLIEEISS